MKQSAKNFRLFILGERSLNNSDLVNVDYSECEVYYMPSSFSIFDVLKFSPDIIFDQGTDKVFDCRNIA